MFIRLFGDFSGIQTTEPRVVKPAEELYVVRPLQLKR